MRNRGRIVDWNDNRGFGFLVPEGGGERIFFHIKAFHSGQARPTGGETVSFELAIDEKKRIHAENVVYTGSVSGVARSEDSRSSRGTTVLLILAVLFLVSVAGFALYNRALLAVATAYLVASVAAFVAFHRDKSAASNGEWRIPENTLHLISLLGGWPGALIAQRLLRHKTRKLSFQVVFWLTVAINVIFLAWLWEIIGS